MLLHFWTEKEYKAIKRVTHIRLQLLEFEDIKKLFFETISNPDSLTIRYSWGHFWLHCTNICLPDIESFGFCKRLLWMVVPSSNNSLEKKNQLTKDIQLYNFPKHLKVWDRTKWWHLQKFVPKCFSELLLLSTNKTSVIEKKKTFLCHLNAIRPVPYILSLHLKEHPSGK